MNELERCRYDALTRQLERMRAMQYAYHRKFFGLLLISSLAMIGLLAVERTWAWITVCLGLVTTGVTAAFFLHFCDFARSHARALEARLNRLLGERTLIASELESDFFYPHGGGRLAGFVLSGEQTFFSGFTAHFCVVWAGATAWSLWNLLATLSVGRFLPLLLGYLLWVGLHAGSLYGWFYTARAERQLIRRLNEAYGLELSEGPVRS
jgi:hypothetical protein